MPQNSIITYPGSYPGTVLDINNVGTGFDSVAPLPQSGDSGYLQDQLRVDSPDYLSIAPRFGRTAPTNDLFNILRLPIERTTFQLSSTWDRAVIAGHPNSTSVMTGVGTDSWTFLRAALERDGSGVWFLRTSLRYLNGSTHVGNLNLESLNVDSLVKGSGSRLTIRLDYNFNSGLAQTHFRIDSGAWQSNPVYNVQANHVVVYNQLRDKSIPQHTLLIAYNFGSGFNPTGRTWYRLFEQKLEYQDVTTLNSSPTLALPTSTGSISAVPPPTVINGNHTLVLPTSTVNIDHFETRTITGNSEIEPPTSEMIIGATKQSRDVEFDAVIPAPVEMEEFNLFSAGISLVNIDSSIVLPILSEPIEIVNNATFTINVASAIDLPLGTSQLQTAPQMFNPSQDVDLVYDNDTPYEIIFNLQNSLGSIPTS
jgi:hypothetical protein